jgi:hypothetical protein
MQPKVSVTEFGITIDIPYQMLEKWAERKTTARLSKEEKLLSIIGNHADGVTKSQLIRQSQWMNKAERNATIDSLISAGKIDSGLMKTSTRAAVVFSIRPGLNLSITEN